MQMNLVRSWVLGLFLVGAVLGSGCKPDFDAEIDICNGLLDEESEIYYIRLEPGLAHPDLPGGDTPEELEGLYRNQVWPQTNLAYLDWVTKLEQIEDRFRFLADLSTGSLSGAQATDLENLRLRIVQLLRRGIDHRLVVEPWTYNAVYEASLRWQEIRPKLLAGYERVWPDHATETISWLLPLFQDQTADFDFNSRVLLNLWRAELPGCGSFTSRYGAPCPLADGQTFPLYHNDRGYLFRDTSISFGIYLGWSNTPRNSIRFVRSPNSQYTGNLKYGEPLMLWVDGLYHLYYRDGSFQSSSDSNRSEWKIVPMWSWMNGKDIDARQGFGIQHLSVTSTSGQTTPHEHFLMFCSHLTGANVGFSNAGPSESDLGPEGGTPTPRDWTCF